MTDEFTEARRAHLATFRCFAGNEWDTPHYAAIRAALARIEALEAALRAMVATACDRPCNTPDAAAALDTARALLASPGIAPPALDTAPEDV